MKNRVLKIQSLVITAILLVTMLASCAASMNATDSGAMAESYDRDMYIVAETAAPSKYAEKMDAAADVYYAANTESKTEGSVLTSTQTGTTEAVRKIIKTVNLTLETKSFDEAVTDLVSAVEGMGGYVESSYISGNSIQRSGSMARYANYTFRIPAEQLSGYVNSLGEKYNVVSRSENASDITDSYYDNEARLTSLLTREERLIEMLKGASDLQYMLEVERELANVRYEIERYYSTLKRYDSQVAMSTVVIRLEEVVEYKDVSQPLPRSFGERLSDAIEESLDNFIDGCEDFLFWLIYALPALVIIAVITLSVILIVRASLKRRHRDIAKKEEDKNGDKK